MNLDSKKIKQLMNNQGLTQTSLAEASSITRGRINTILQAERSTVRESTAKQIARALGVSVDEIAINDDHLCKEVYKEFIKSCMRHSIFVDAL